MLNRKKMLSGWDDSRQFRYRAAHPDMSVVLNFLLDASPSMRGQPEIDLRQSFNMYLEWLKSHSSPMSMAAVRCFSSYLDPYSAVPMSQLAPLDKRTYDPSGGDGTALYRAIGETCSDIATGRGSGQQVLVVFTDGLDNISNAYGWTLEKTRDVLRGLLRTQGWLAVFLGAFPRALETGYRLGFSEGNCLMLSSDQIPEAFRRLTQATERYLAAGPGQRKLLAQTGVF